MTDRATLDKLKELHNQVQRNPYAVEIDNACIKALRENAADLIAAGEELAKLKDEVRCANHYGLEPQNADAGRYLDLAVKRSKFTGEE